MPTDKAMDAPGMDRVPLATYRIQLNRDCTLAQVRELVSYLHDLGVSHIYSSPLLKAVPGSAHGYDICDFHELNPELGTSKDFAKLHDELARRQMGLVLDVVPNHMGIDGGHNRWWCDVLTHGSSSRYAACFDIDWQAADPRLRNKVAMPILTERYHEALRRGSIRLAEAEGSLCLQYGGQTLPVSPESVSALLLRATESVPRGGVAAIRAAVEEINRNAQALDKFIQMQNYVLMFWRNGHEMLNYRRFFTITSMAGVRIEEERIFEQAFALISEWLDKGWVNGLRVDCIDGLRQPEQFLRRLRGMAPKAWIVVEKILEAGEPLNPSWPVDGTTGYDFISNLNGIFIDPEGERPLSEFYKEFTGDTAEYPDLARAKKHMVMDDQLAAEASRLTDLLVQISARHWECRDFCRDELKAAWEELAAWIPVYRTYVGAGADPEVSKRDAGLIHEAASAAREHCRYLPSELFDFLEALLSFHERGGPEDDFVLRFQQLTGALMAKAVEDTAFYCYARLVALNEVGSDPGRFGLSLPLFHQFCEHQQSLWPGSVSATSTHDTKWGGDTRARLALLSERPREWIEAVRRWSKMNEPKRHHAWPDRKTEYLFYQALVGAWPLARDRALEYVRKAAREAKEQTRWRQPVAEFEDALENFVKGVMEDSDFMDDAGRFVAPLLDLGWIHSLSQTLVKLTACGVPDIYQGAELWDLCLMDPDNRRPVDYAIRKQNLAEAKNLSVAEAWRRRESGLPKIWLIWRVLEFRRGHPALFGSGGAYKPLTVSGAEAARVITFARGQGAIIVAPRFMGTFAGDWADTKVELPPGDWRNVLTDSPARSGLLKELTADFPVALLSREEAS